MARTERRRAKAAPRREAAQAGRTRENLPQPAAAAKPQTATPRPQAQAKRRNPFGFISRLMPRGVSDVIAELRKVTWPTLAETRYLTIVVAIVAVVVGIFLGVVDLIFGYTIERLFF